MALSHQDGWRRVGDAVKGVVWLGVVDVAASVPVLGLKQFVFGEHVFVALAFSVLSAWLAGAVVLVVDVLLPSHCKMMPVAVGGMLVRAFAAYWGCQLAFWFSPQLYWPHFLLLVVWVYCVSLTFEVVWITRRCVVRSRGDE